MTTKTELSVSDALEFQGYSAYLDGYVAGAAALAEHLKKTRVAEFARKAQAEKAEPPKQEPPKQERRLHTGSHPLTATTCDDSQCWCHTQPEAHVNGVAHAS